MRVVKRRIHTGPYKSDVKHVCSSCGAVRFFNLSQRPPTDRPYMCASCLRKAVWAKRRAAEQNVAPPGTTDKE